MLTCDEAFIFFCGIGLGKVKLKYSWSSFSVYSMDKKEKKFILKTFFY